MNFKKNKEKNAMLKSNAVSFFAKSIFTRRCIALFVLCIAIPSMYSDSKEEARSGNGLYMVVDLQNWKVRYSAKGPDLSDDTCRTTELWLRRIEPGTFIMGSPEEEQGKSHVDERQHRVTLTRPFFIGVFECTQKQWELVKARKFLRMIPGCPWAYRGRPSRHEGDTCPVECVTYNDIRGRYASGSSHYVEATSFMGVLQEKTGLVFDLPTEAEWEYACRAGTITALNSGKNLTRKKACSNMAEVGRYYFNHSDGKGGYGEHTKVGSYLPNAWGLYDMHGNVWEWCLDRYGDYPDNAVTDPKGVTKGDSHVVRGGGWNSLAHDCSSANRWGENLNPCSFSSEIGFRVAFWPFIRR